MELFSDKYVSENANCIRYGNFNSVLQQIPTDLKNTRETLHKLLKDLSLNEQKELLICLGIASLSSFLQKNWTGPISLNVISVNSDTEILMPNNETFAHCEEPGLIAFALNCFEMGNEVNPHSLDMRWWLLRTLYINQLLLDELSPEIHSKLMSILDSFGISLKTKYDDDFIKLPAEVELESTRPTLQLPAGELGIKCRLEAIAIFLHYGHITAADLVFKSTCELFGVDIMLTGVLGKRTKHQTSDVAQLVCKVNLRNSEHDAATSLNEKKPSNIKLCDDDRLDEIELKDDNEVNYLSSTCVSILLSFLMLRKKCLPSDELSIEENKAILSRILNIKSNDSWAVRCSALLFRSKVECVEKRAVERAMRQVQVILDNLSEPDPPLTHRLTDLFLSGLPSYRNIQLILADILVALGCVKSSLDIYLQLKHWPAVITCYNLLKMRHKAKEIIEQELAKGETVELLCLLGDATDDVECYEKAWNLCDRKSARPQRHWANFLYNRGEYKASIEHFEQSLAVNSLQPLLWSRLGFAALTEEQWEMAARAYRHACALEPEDTFQAWNNLARCYAELKQHRKAYFALQEALRLEHNNWRVWDNFMLVAAELGELSDIVRGYHKVLDLKKDKHLDLNVLRALVKGYHNVQICNETDVNQIEKLKTSIATLFGRLSSQLGLEPEISKLYADIFLNDHTDDALHKQRHLITKALTSATLKPAWYLNPKVCELVLELCERLVDVTLESGKDLVTTKLSVNGYLKTITANNPGKYNAICSKIHSKLN